MHTTIPLQIIGNPVVHQIQRPACNDCDQKQLLESFEVLNACAQASRNTGCCSHLLAGADNDEPITPIERIAYWASVGIVVGSTVGVVFGLSGYLLVKTFS